MPTTIMGRIKRMFPNNLKQEGKYFLYGLLKIPYNRVDLPVEIMKWLPLSDRAITFIDIGAYKGHFSTSVSSYYKIKKGILIEPIPRLIPRLTEKFNDSKKFDILNVAVSDKKSKTEFYLSEELHQMSSLLKIKEEFHDPFGLTFPGKKIAVETETLDDIWTKSGLNEIDILKIDVQGAEHLVLQSGTNMLKITKLIYTEFSYKPLYEGSSTFFEIYKILNDNNFRLVSNISAITVRGEVVQGDCLFVNKDLLETLF